MYKVEEEEGMRMKENKTKRKVSWWYIQYRFSPVLAQTPRQKPKLSYFS